MSEQIKNKCAQCPHSLDVHIIKWINHTAIKVCELCDCTRPAIHPWRQYVDTKAIKESK